MLVKCIDVEQWIYFTAKNRVHLYKYSNDVIITL